MSVILFLVMQLYRIEKKIVSLLSEKLERNIKDTVYYAVVSTISDIQEGDADPNGLWKAF